MPLDPAREWLAAGITGIARGREWDAVVTLRGGGMPGDDVAFVVLPDGTVVRESSGDVDPTPFSEALAASIALPYRALAVRTQDVWAVGAVGIDVERLDPDPPGDDLELTWSGSVRTLTADGVPADPARAAALERVAAGRVAGAYAAHAHRLRGDLWELSVFPL